MVNDNLDFVDIQITPRVKCGSFQVSKKGNPFHEQSLNDCIITEVLELPFIIAIAYILEPLWYSRILFNFFWLHICLQPNWSQKQKQNFYVNSM